MTEPDRVVVVTGASKGIGRAIAAELAGARTALVVSARGAAELERAAADLRPRAAAVEAVVADVSTPDGARAPVERALATFGRIDVLVNNAGGGPIRPLLELTDDDWQAGLALNFLSAVRGAAAATPAMIAGGGGSIINVASSVAREPDALFGPYGAAKAALVNYTKALANATAQHGIRANCITPGIVDTEGSRAVGEESARVTGRTVDEIMAAMLRKHPIPLGRIGRVEEIAGLVGYLVSDRAAWITGSVFTIDGGAQHAAW
ncbi:MAG: fabG10 [Actinomycetia bacterium]|nr:fabG10 [Actinomycetes bacterium]